MPQAGPWQSQTPSCIFLSSALRHPQWTQDSAEMGHKEPGDKGPETWLFVVTLGLNHHFFRGLSISLKPRFELNYQGSFQETIIVGSSPWIFYYFFLSGGNKTVFKPPKMRTFKAYRLCEPSLMRGGGRWRSRRGTSGSAGKRRSEEGAVAPERRRWPVLRADGELFRSFADPLMSKW